MTILDRIANKFWRTFVIPKAVIKISNSFFKIPRIQNNQFYKSSYQSEKWLIQLLKLISKKKKIISFIDVGVNIGQTLLKIKAIDPKIEYIGFEPNPFCFSFTQQIISVNKLTNCKMIPCGLSNQNHLLKLSLPIDNDLFDSSASVIEGFRENQTTQFQYVSALKLDDLIGEFELKSIDLIKIDVEGGELEIIEGMLTTIENFKPIIIIEVLPSYNSNNIVRINRQKKLFQLMKKVSYQIFHIKFNAEKLYYEEVFEFPIHKNANESDYILLPKHINESILEPNLKL